MQQKSRKIKRVQELPDWFSLVKYVSASELDAEGWVNNLHVRRELLRAVGSPRWKKHQGDGNTALLCSIKAELDAVRSVPVLGCEDYSILSYCRYHGMLYPEDGVRDMTLNDLLWSTKLMPDDDVSFVRDIRNETDDSESFYDAVARATVKYKVDQSKLGEPVPTWAECGYFRVDLRLPESLLVEQFKLAVKRHREIIKKTPRPAFGNWIKSGVLPYLDLKIWEREEGISIPNRVMADAIYPNGEGGEEDVRKTTSKLASDDELLSLQHLDSLASLARYEKAEKTKR
jgi:hypothetical protein